MQSSNETGFLNKVKQLFNPLLVPVLAIVTAVIVGGLIIYSVGGDPIKAYMGLIQGAFGSSKALSETAAMPPDSKAGEP